MALEHTRLMQPQPIDWKQYHSYRVFDEFLERFVLQRKSYVTKHPNTLDFAKALLDIEKRFVVNGDESEATYEEKIANQFGDASELTKIVFANIEYLWAMPIENLNPDTKRSYGRRWFSDDNLLVSGDRYFFGYPNIIADPGPWYLRNKYWELVALLRILSIVTADPGIDDLSTLKQKIARICYSAIYDKIDVNQPFYVPRFCGVHCALMHLADPEQYESIISSSHRKQICAVFGHLIENPSEDTEELLKQIRLKLYDSFGVEDVNNRKYRWFFYSDDLKPFWIDKKSKRQQVVSSATLDVRNEEDAFELEGDKEEFSGFRIHRSSKLVKATKVRDNYTCRACNFHFENLIVHVHHLDPISESKLPKITKIGDLITLCPNCHYLAHYWLRQDFQRFKKLEPLLEKLRLK